MVLVSLLFKELLQVKQFKLWVSIVTHLLYSLQLWAIKLQLLDNSIITMRAKELNAFARFAYLNAFRNLSMIYFLISLTNPLIVTGFPFSVV